MNTLSSEQNKKTAEVIKKVEKDFALDLPLLVDETARDVKILNTIAAIEREVTAREHFLPIPPAPTSPFN